MLSVVPRGKDDFLSARGANEIRNALAARFFVKLLPSRRRSSVCVQSAMKRWRFWLFIKNSEAPRSPRAGFCEGLQRCPKINQRMSRGALARREELGNPRERAVPINRGRSGPCAPQQSATPRGQAPLYSTTASSFASQQSPALSGLTRVSWFHFRQNGN